MDLNKKIEARRRELEMEKLAQRKAESEREEKYLSSEIVKRQTDAVKNSTTTSATKTLQDREFHKKLSKAANGRLSFSDWAIFFIIGLFAFFGFAAAWWLGLAISFYALYFLGTKIKKYEAEIIEEAKKTEEFKKHFESNTGKGNA